MTSEKRRGRRGLYALAGLFVLLPFAGVAGGQALPLMQGLAGVIGAPWREARRWRPPAYAIAPLVFIAWALVSTLWCSNPTQVWLHLIGAIAAGLLCILTMRALTPAQTRQAFWCAAVASAALILLCGFEAATHAALNHIAQPDALDWVVYRNPAKGVVITLCLLAPVAAWLWAQGGQARIFAIALAIGAGIMAAQFDMTANLVAFAVGVAMLAATLCAPRTAIVAFFGGAAAWSLIVPWAMLRAPTDDSLPFSWADRLTIWRFAAERVADKPWFGWGLDASRSFQDKLHVQGQTTAAISLHPHNGFLQVWLETGAVGAVLLASSLAGAGWALAARKSVHRLQTAAILSAASVIFVFDNLSFGVWQEWWIATCFLPFSLLAGQMEGDAPSDYKHSASD